ncbi:MAG: pinensin family lanthipeptide [Bacteroidota bacterium]
MSKRKLNLDELEVESFVTSFESDHDATVKGGAFDPSWVDGCRSAMIWCEPIKIKTIKTLTGGTSAVDACPSAPSGCTFDTTVVQTKTVVDPVRGF